MWKYIYILFKFYLKLKLTFGDEPANGDELASRDEPTSGDENINNIN